MFIESRDASKIYAFQDDNDVREDEVHTIESDAVRLSYRGRGRGGR